jgi:hypothetical protein
MRGILDGETAWTKGSVGQRFTSGKENRRTLWVLLETNRNWFENDIIKSESEEHWK